MPNFIAFDSKKHILLITFDILLHITVIRIKKFQEYMMPVEAEILIAHYGHVVARGDAAIYAVMNNTARETLGHALMTGDELVEIMQAYAVRKAKAENIDLLNPKPAERYHYANAVLQTTMADPNASIGSVKAAQRLMKRAEKYKAQLERRRERFGYYDVVVAINKNPKPFLVFAPA